MRRLVFPFLLLLAACTPSMPAEQRSFLQELAGRPMICEKGDDCDEKWNRAIEWVTKHTEEGLHTVNDHLITTNMVSAGGRDPLRYPEFSVVRYEENRHSYRIEFTSFCEHGFECGDRALKLRANFVTTIMGLPPGVTEVRPGVYQKTVTH